MISSDMSIFHLILRALIHFKLVFIQRMYRMWSFQSSSCRYLVFIVPFVEEISSNICFGYLCQESGGCRYLYVFLSPLMLCWSTWLFLWWYNIDLLLWLPKPISCDFQHCSFCLELLWLFRVFCASTWISWFLFFWFCEECCWNFDSIW